MRFTAPKKELMTALQRVQGVVERRNTMPILSNILIEAEKKGVRILATDLEVGIQGRYQANVTEEGRIVLSARKLYEIIRELADGDVLVSSNENNWVNVESGKSRFRITGLPAEDFPAFPEIPEESFFEINPLMVAALIRHTIFATGENDSRYVLNGVLFYLKHNDLKNWCLRLVGTNGHRLAVAESSLTIDPSPFQEKEISAIVPKKGMVEIKKILEDNIPATATRLALSKSQLVLERGDIVLVARLVEGNYPNYEQVIPKDNKHRTTVKKAALQGALRRVSVLAREKTHAIRLSLGKEKLLLSSNNPEVGEAHEEMEVNSPGEEIVTGFNAQYLLDIMENHDGEEVILELKDALSPCLIQEEGKKCFYVVMPMRV